jgi:DNA repair protein RadC
MAHKLPYCVMLDFDQSVGGWYETVEAARDAARTLYNNEPLRCNVSIHVDDDECSLIEDLGISPGSAAVNLALALRRQVSEPAPRRRSTAVKSTEPATYQVKPTTEYHARAAESAAEDEVIGLALKILAGRLNANPNVFDSPQSVRHFVQLQIGGRDHEVFGVIFMDNQHRMIEFREMFRGTATQTAVYPREIMREALKLNASAVILAHNHPSGVLEASRADEQLTQQTKLAGGLIDVRVLDHIIVGPVGVLSFAERGLM